MKVILADKGIELECTCDEFQSIYPKLVNSNTTTANIETVTSLSIDKVKRGKVRPTSNRYKISADRYEQYLKTLADEYQNKQFEVRAAAEKLHFSPNTMYRAVKLAIKEGVIEKIGHRGFKFTHKQIVKQQSDNMKKAPELNEFVSELSVMVGTYEFNEGSVYMHFKNIDRKVLAGLLVDALKAGLLIQNGHWLRVVELQAVAK